MSNEPEYWITETQQAGRRKVVWGPTYSRDIAERKMAAILARLKRNGKPSRRLDVIESYSITEFAE